MTLIDKELTEKVIGACFDVSNELGSGFLESVYEKSLMIALKDKGISATAQVPLEVEFRGSNVGKFLADIVVEDRLVIELKAAKWIAVEHEGQLLNYLKASGIKVGLLVNFGKARLEWKRFVC